MDTYETVTLITNCGLNLIVIIIALWAGIIAYRQLRFRTLSNLFDKFNDKKARKSRKKIYEGCLKLMDKETLYQIQTHEDQITELENIINNFDLVALNVKNKLIFKKDAIRVYGDSIIRCWVILRRWIDFTRRERNQLDTLWNNVGWLADKAINDDSFKDWKEHGVTIYTSKKILTFDYYSGELIFSKPVNGCGENKKKKSKSH